MFFCHFNKNFISKNGRGCRCRKNAKQKNYRYFWRLCWKFLFGVFFLFYELWKKTQSTTWGDKKCVVDKPAICATQKGIQLWLWFFYCLFQWKCVRIHITSSKTLCLFKIKKWFATLFFALPSYILRQNLIKMEWIWQNAKQKNSCNYRWWKIAIFGTVRRVVCCVCEMTPDWHVFNAKGKKSIFFHPFPPSIPIIIELKSLQNLDFKKIASVRFLFRFNQFLAICLAAGRK